MKKSTFALLFLIFVVPIVVAMPILFVAGVLSFGSNNSGTNSGYKFRPLFVGELIQLQGQLTIPHLGLLCHMKR